jgi:hypothetical protein
MNVGACTPVDVQIALSRASVSTHGEYVTSFYFSRDNSLLPVTGPFGCSSAPATGKRRQCLGKHAPIVLEGFLLLRANEKNSQRQARPKNETRKRETTAMPSRLIIARARVDGSGTALTARRDTESKLVCDPLFPWSKISRGPPEADDV